MFGTMIYCLQEGDDSVTNSCVENYNLPKRKDMGLLPISSGEEQCAPNHSWGAGVRSHYLIHYVISGTGVFYCGPNKFTLEKGQVFVIFPGTVVKYQADASNPWHYAWVAMHGEEAAEIFRQAGVTLFQPVATVHEPATAIQLLRDMPTERSAEPERNLLFKARLYEFLSLLIPRKTRKEDGENAYLTSAQHYIKAHYNEDISVDQVAQHISISRKYLFAIFKKHLGISPKEYIMDYRIKRAKEFLEDPDIPIGNIAYSVGYRDPMTFSKMFRLKTGLSPSQYREAIR